MEWKVKQPLRSVSLQCDFYRKKQGFEREKKRGKYLPSVSARPPGLHLNPSFEHTKSKSGTRNMRATAREHKRDLQREEREEREERERGVRHGVLRERELKQDRKENEGDLVLRSSRSILTLVLGRQQKPQQH